MPLHKTYQVAKVFHRLITDQKDIILLYQCLYRVINLLSAADFFCPLAICFPAAGEEKIIQLSFRQISVQTHKSTRKEDRSYTAPDQQCVYLKTLFLLQGQTHENKRLAPPSLCA